jgi:hypothetical protein
MTLSLTATIILGTDDRYKHKTHDISNTPSQARSRGLIDPSLLNS